MHARIRSAINEGYFASYVYDLKAGVVVDLRHLASSFQVPSFGQNISYRKMIRFLLECDRLKELKDCTPDYLIRLGNDPGWRRALQSAVTYVGQPSPKLASSDSHLSGISLAFSSVSDKEQFMIQNYPLTNPYQALQEHSKSLHSVLCLTVAAIEFTAVRAHLKKTFGNEKIVYLDEKRQFYAAEYCDPQSQIIWHLGGLSFQGEADAVDGVHRFCTFLDPTIVLMVGMCMGMPKKELTVGDVVIYPMKYLDLIINASLSVVISIGHTVHGLTMGSISWLN